MPSSSDDATRDATSSRPELGGRPYVPLRGRSRFRDVYRRGSRRRSGPVSVVRLDLGGGGPPEVGVVASRGVGNAVRRNRAKRRLREALRRVPLRRGTAYVVIASAEVPDVPFDRLVDHVGKAVRSEGGDE